MSKDNFTMEVMVGDWWLKANDLPDKEPLRSVMVDIIGADASNCGNKKAYLSLVKHSAKGIIKKLSDI